jgi:hypothetical protein
MKTNLLPSLIRIATATVVGFVFNLPLTPVVLDWLNVDTGDAKGRIGGAVAAAVSLVYYAVVRTLEEKYAAGAGWLLLRANRPQYANAPIVPPERPGESNWATPGDTTTTRATPDHDGEV